MSNATNVISVGISDQASTAGFSYFPNNSFEIGADVFISQEYASPNFWMISLPIMTMRCL